MFQLLALITAAALAVADQLIKRWAVANLAGAASVSVIPGLFRLTYVENYGAAFGIFEGKARLLSVVVSAVLIALVFAIVSGRIKSRFLIGIFALVAAGGAGNLIDRVRLGFVVDYLDFSALFGFPVFNLADCFVVCGTFLMLIYILKTDILADQGKVGNKQAGEGNDEPAE